MRQPDWVGAMSEFEALRVHPPAKWDETTVSRYNNILTELQAASGYDLERFCVPDTELRGKVTSVRRGGYSGQPGSVTRSKTRYCDPQAMAQRLVAVATYIASFQPAPRGPAPLGFQPPE